MPEIAKASRFLLDNCPDLVKGLSKSDEFVAAMKKLGESDLGRLTKAEREALEEFYEKVGLKGLIKGGKGTVWIGKDKYVPELANAIEQMFPGRVKGVEKIIKSLDGRIITDLDIELDDIVIQVKSGSAKGLTSQMIRTAEATGKKVISYTPDISQASAVLRNVRQNGYKTFTSMDDILEYLSYLLK